MRVLLADKLADFVVHQLERAGCALINRPSAKGEALVELLREVEPEVLVVRSTRVERTHIEAAPGLALIVRAGAGINSIDMTAAAERAVHVANCPGRNADAVAELTIGHLINLDRRIVDNAVALRAGEWAKGRLGGGRGLKGRTIAVLGAGAIGKAVVKTAQALGMQVKLWDKILTPEMAAGLGVVFASSAVDACRGAHALSVHLPLTDQTRGLVRRAHLDALEPAAYVINTSRGGIIDERALLDAIRDRGIRAGLDVFENEPGGKEGSFDDEAIRTNPHIYGTHHIGASTAQASEAVADDVVRIVCEFHQTGCVARSLDVASLSRATHAFLVRHRDEVGVLAAVLGRLSESGINVQEMENTIFEGGTAAVARIQLSTRPSPSVVSAVAAMEHVYAARLVAL